MAQPEKLSIVEWLGRNTTAADAVPAAAEMHELIDLLTRSSAPAGMTERELVTATLQATEDRQLLQIFTHSRALNSLHEWLSESLHTESLLRLLQLLDHLPISVQSLQSSGIGKTVNKLRKSSDARVQTRAAELLKCWKALASLQQTEEPQAASDVSSSSVPAKRPPSAGHDGPESDHKRLRASGTYEDSSLDSALSAQTAQRKASLKPDHLKTRPVQPLATSISSCRRDRQAGSQLHAAAPPATDTKTQTAAGPASVMAAPKAPIEQAPPRAAKRVRWAEPSNLCEVREYLVEESAEVCECPLGRQHITS